MNNTINLNKIKKEKSISELLEFSIINLDKIPGKTSFEIDCIIKNELGLKKTSHFGTLDPMVTGVLPVALNRACKLSNFFMHKDKIYIGEMHLHSDISEKELRENMKEFTGKIMQKPPVKSRVKRVEREREIKKFEILKIKNNNKDVEFIAEVQAGTYIRKLISDLGDKIGGAHMSKLRRISAGIFEEKDLISLEKFKEAVRLWKEKGDETPLRDILTPAEIISELYPVVQLNKSSLKSVLTGKPLMKKDILDSDIGNLEEGEIFVVFLGQQFIEVAKKVNEKEIIARPLFVFQPLS
jgi:H/ACA ribonucleoprotein complex subunit 4